MAPKWNFTPRSPREKARNSANDAFFTADNIGNVSAALIREGIQNSLDAADGSVRQVRVRVAFIPHDDKEASAFLRASYEPSKTHFEKGIKELVVEDLINDSIGHLVFEDFGTRGLRGDISQTGLDDAQENAFFSFFRAEGISPKGGKSLGRWGIGKQVFPSSSELHSFFAITVRDEQPRSVMMGSALVKSHSIDGVDYTQDAWYGLSTGDRDAIMPVQDADELSAFCRAFKLERGDKAGLSIVIPYVNERVKFKDLSESVASNFFWPILTGELEVSIEWGLDAISLNSDTLEAISKGMSSTDSNKICFANWASTVKSTEQVALVSSDKFVPVWKDMRDALLDKDKVAIIRQKLDENNRVAIKIPLWVRPKDGEAKQSYFMVYAEKCRDNAAKPIFIRDGIVISGIPSAILSGIRALVVVDDPPLAGLLGDSEGVSHMEWQKDSPNFYRRYTYGPQTILFVTRSVSEILKSVHDSDTEIDTDLLKDFFSIPSESGAKEKSKEQTKKGQEPEIDPLLPIPQPRPSKVIIGKINGGFVIKPGPAIASALPLKLNISAGYAVRRGDAVRRWSEEDFCFNISPSSSIRCNGTKNVSLRMAEGNRLMIEIREPDFNFEVTGFDPKRDLVVRISEKKNKDEEDV